MIVTRSSTSLLHQVDLREFADFVLRDESYGVYAERFVTSRSMLKGSRCCCRWSPRSRSGSSVRAHPRRTSSAGVAVHDFRPPNSKLNPSPMHGFCGGAGTDGGGGDGVGGVGGGGVGGGLGGGGPGGGGDGGGGEGEGAQVAEATAVAVMAAAVMAVGAGRGNAGDGGGGEGG